MQIDPTPTKDLLQKALQANRDHQSALDVYTKRLEEELGTVDKLLNVTDTAADDEPEIDVGGFILIPGSVKATGLVSPNDLLSQHSPFAGEAEKRNRYLNFTTIHTMKAKELDALAEAVRTENYRKYAFDAQKRGLDPFSSLDDKSQNAMELNKEGLDWERIADKVSSASSVPRTARECEIRWLGDRHPGINHGAWEQDELLKLNNILGDCPDGAVDWNSVAQKLGTNRTPIDCMRNGIWRKHHDWTPESDDRLSEAVEIYGTDNWPLVAKYVSEDVTVAQCQIRYTRTLDPKLKRGAWSSEEDDRLRIAVSIYGNSWIDVASLVEGRNRDQCRDRWSDKIGHNVAKRKWTEVEDLKLLEAVSAVGEKWKEVSERFDGTRTDSMCRTRYVILSEKKSKRNAGPSRVGSKQPQGSHEARLDLEISSPNINPAGPSFPSNSLIKFAVNQNPQRPRPKPRRKKDTKLVDNESEAAASSSAGTPDFGSGNTEPVVPLSRPKPKPRAKGRGKEVALHDDAPSEANGGGIRTMVSTGKGKDLDNPTTMLPMGKVVKRINTQGDLQSTPSKRQRKSTKPFVEELKNQATAPSDEVYSLHEEEEEEENGLSTVVSKSKPKAVQNASDSRGKVDTNIPFGDAAAKATESTSSQQQGLPSATTQAPGAEPYVPPQATKRGKPSPDPVPTRKQPARAASRKSIH